MIDVAEARKLSEDSDDDDDGKGKGKGDGSPPSFPPPVWAARALSRVSHKQCHVLSWKSSATPRSPLH